MGGGPLTPLTCFIQARQDHVNKKRDRNTLPCNVRPILRANVFRINPDSFWKKEKEYPILCKGLPGLSCSGIFVEHLKYLHSVLCTEKRRKQKREEEAAKKESNFHKMHPIRSARFFFAKRSISTSFSDSFSWKKEKK